MQKYKNLTLFILSMFFFIGTNAATREKLDFGTQWKFQKNTSSAPSAPGFNDSSWESVTIPHTWNATDAQDGGNNYARTIGWYRKTFSWNNSYEGKRVFLEVLAASLKSETYINGTLVGSHKGGYNSFRYDITTLLKKNEPNVIAMKVDNRYDDNIAPLSGDFSFIGGMYRRVFLVVCDPIHVDLEDNGSNGLYLTTSEVSSASAKLEVRAKIVNKSTETKHLSLKATLKNPDNFTGITEIPNPLFNTSNIAPGGVVKSVEENNVIIPAGSSYEFKKQISVSNPRLWDGLTDPFRYQVDFQINENGMLLDEVSDYVGLRFFHADNTGFYLNGRLYPLRGVNRHQDWKDMGYAITENEHNVDFGMIYEIGANAVRLAHYPQDPYFHELFDKYGIVVWVEIPFVDKFGTDTTQFMNATCQQLREMIRQRYNRPSILMWGLQNEVSTGSYDTQMSKIIPQLHNLTKTEDPTGRLTVQAQAGADRSNWTTDLFGKNQYPGWYQSGTFGSYMDGYKNKHLVGGKYRPVGMSEYGAGGNPQQHEIIKLSGTAPPGSPYGHQNPWHPEEYQSLIHELAIKDIVARPWIWGTFVWNMFDFASDSRNEGQTPGINDKGMVTHDRSIKKDAFYVYKANWSSIPMVHIASSRYMQRETTTTPVKVYTNRAAVELFVNGVSQGVRKRTAANCGILEWSNVELSNKGVGQAGKNNILAKSDDNIMDEVNWYRVPASSTLLISSKLTIDNSQKAISLTTTVPVAQLLDYIKSEHNVSFDLMEADGLTPVTNGNVMPGMKLLVTAEDGVSKATYEFVVQHIAFKKKATADSEENTTNTAAKAVDGDVATRWAAPNNATPTAPHWLEVDLGKNYILNNVGINWFNNPTNGRAYKYTVLAKKENEINYEMVVNRSANTQADFVSDEISNTMSRYVKVNITGSTNASAYAYPSIFELQVNGWMISSSVYDIDFDTKTITLPATDVLVELEDFLKNIVFDGNETHRVESAAYYIVDGAQLIITDSRGKENVFVLKFKSTSGLKTLAPENLFEASNRNNELKVRVKCDLDVNLTIFDVAGKQLFCDKIKGEKLVQVPLEVCIIQITTPTGEIASIKHLMKK